MSSERLQHEITATCNVNRRPHEAVVIEKAGGPLSQQHLHTAGEAFLSSQVEDRAAGCILHVHVGCGFCQHPQRLPVTLISLKERRRAGSQDLQAA